jgi:beta-lactamase superfamily II metal-dependent hydrolase
VQDAGVTKIDYLISTHITSDHIGGMAELAKRLLIGTFVDHGPSVEAREQVPRVSRPLRRAVQQSEAHRREARRSRPRDGARLAHRQPQAAKR